MPFLPDLYTLSTYLDMGGFVMPPLLAVAVVLWYALTYRLLAVKGSKMDPRVLIERARRGDSEGRSAITERAAALAVKRLAETDSRERLKSVLNEEYAVIKAELNRHKSLVRALVAVAPLLGLLGTVDGMIETFNALGDMALFSQSGGIAGGISRALFTTQMGLAISIPGILVGRIVDRKQLNIVRELDQIRDQICADKR